MCSDQIIDISDKTRILFGPPGTGKTTKLLDIVDEFLQQGIPPERIAYCSFTKKAAQEAIDRAKVKFKYDEKRFRYFRTLHSIAYSMLQLNSSRIIKPEHYKTVGKRIGMDLDVVRANSDQELTKSNTEGDFVIRIYELSRSRMVPLKDVFDELSTEFIKEVTFDKVVSFAESFNNFKKQFNIYDFNDFLDMAEGQLDVDVFIIDEAQDLTKQQWNFFYKILHPNTKHVIVAGDDDQAIYYWSGADVDNFLNLKGEKEVLPISYRLPKSIWDLANMISRKIQHREPKEWSCKSDPGKIVYINMLRELNLDKGEWLFLTRTNRELLEFRRYLRDHGYVYKWRNKWSNKEDPVLAVLYYENLRKGKKFYHKDIQTILKFMKDPPKVVFQNTPFCFEEIPWKFTKDDTWKTALQAMKDDDKWYIMNLRKRGISLLDEGKIILSTIHSAKGGEAENVVVKLGAGGTIDDELLHGNRDNELRVWYVGVTRAQKTLYLYGDHRFLQEL